MEPAFIYFKEIDFRLDFSHEEHIQEIIFLENKDYYIVSLNCYLVIKEHIEHKKNFLKSFLKKEGFKKDQHIK